jgi:hypothetical protein
MKHLYAGAIVGGILALLIAATVVMWAFLSLFISKELAALLTGGIILVMAATAVLDLVTEKNA